jgi:hypothetical protein
MVPKLICFGSDSLDFGDRLAQTRRRIDQLRTSYPGQHKPAEIAYKAAWLLKKHARHGLGKRFEKSKLPVFVPKAGGAPQTDIRGEERSPA